MQLHELAKLVSENGYIITFANFKTEDGWFYFCKIEDLTIGYNQEIYFEGDDPEKVIKDCGDYFKKAISKNNNLSQ